MNPNKDNEVIRDWPEASNFKRSIRLEFTLFVSAIILVMMIAMGFVISEKYIDTVTRNVAEKLLVQARSYSGPAGKLFIAAEEPDELLLNNICRKLASDNPDVFWAGIIGQSDIFLAHTDIKQVISGSGFEPITATYLSGILFAQEGFEKRNDTIFISVPIKENEIRLGNMVVAASTKTIEEARQSSLMAIITITALMVILGIPITMFSLHRKLRPISIISGRLKSVNFDEINLEIPVSQKNEFGYLAETLNVMGRRLKVAQKERLERERMDRELEIAREIQARILPKSYPISENLEFSGMYRSAKQVGGDYYDFINFDNDHLGFLVADVSGKSLPGMLVMLMTRDMVLRFTQKTRDPQQILSNVNRELRLDIKPGMFVTMFLGVLDKRTGEFVFASAGHNPLIRLSADSRKSELIKTKGFPLALMPSEQFDRRLEVGRISLEPGDLIVQYTDGINEAQNANEEQYGMDPIIRLIDSDNSASPTGLTEKLIKDLEDFVGEAEQYDDITLLVLKWKGQGQKETRTEGGKERIPYAH